MVEINNIIEQAVEACNLVLYGIEQTHEGTVIYLDSEDNNITIEDCEMVMKQISYSTNTDHLHLEVSSKGIYPPLFLPAHFEAAIGQWAKIRTNEKSYKGIVLSYTDEEIVLEKGENTFSISPASIKSARLVPEPTGE